MKNKIPQFLQRKLKMKFSSAKKFPEEIKQFMIDYANFYKWPLDNDIKLIFKLMKTGTTHLPECAYDGCTNKVQLSNIGKIQRCCSRIHSMRVTSLERFGVENPVQSDVIKEKMKKNSLEKHGVEYPIASTIVREKSRKTMLERHGVEYTGQSAELMNKVTKTSLERYGVECSFQSENNKQKSKKTCLERYGVEYSFQSENNKQKSKKTSLERYGVEYPQQSQQVKIKTNATNLERYGGHPFKLLKFQNKFKKSCIKKYGVEYPMQSKLFMDKIHSSTFQLKEYKWKTGEILIVQGYEPIVLKELEDSGYSFSDIKTSPKDVPVIKYYFDGEKTYYPDIFIPKENLIIRS